MKRSEIQRKTPLRAKAPMQRTAKPVAEPKRRIRKCAVPTCRAPFEPRSMTHKTCGPACAELFVASEKARAEKRERQQGLAKLKRRADYFKETQAVLNRWIREVRDAGKPCVSCGRHHQGQNHAGHFLSRGSHPHLALVEANIALQCMPCNVHLSGNQLAFRRGLIERIGIRAVELLESDTDPRKYTIEQLKAMKVDYLNRLKEAKRGTRP
jgi:5-methylcytosine-specific restriction endonuclease McrA